MHRRSVLKLIGLATTASFASGPAAESMRPGKPGTETAQDLEHLADRYQALYHSTAPAVLMTPVVAHLETLRDLLREGGTASLRRRLLVNQARVATLAGRLAFFDLQDSLTARGYCNLALESAREAGDHLQAAAALAHTAFIPAADYGFSAALDYLRGAAHHVARRPDGRVASWVSAIESEIQTNAGAHTVALESIERARQALAEPGLTADLPWFDYYDATRLSGFAGYATLKAGRQGEARAALTAALSNLPRTAVKQRAVFLADIASVELSAGDLDRACRIAGDAAGELQQAGYAVGFGRLRDFRRAVQPWAAGGAVHRLGQARSMGVCAAPRRAVRRVPLAEGAPCLTVSSLAELPASCAANRAMSDTLEQAAAMAGPERDQDAAEDMGGLARLPGLEVVRDQLADVIAVIRAEAARREAGIPAARPAWKNLVFVGGPGSGKSRAAAAVGRIYRALEPVWELQAA